MNAAFEFATSAKVIFGPGVARDTIVDVITGRWGVTSVALVWGRSGESRYGDLAMRLRDQGVAVATFVCAREPTIDDIQEGADIIRQKGCSAVVSIGGGSVMDYGKALAALATNLGEVLDYCEVIGKGMPLVETPLKMIAVPTTAGTGSEVTRNAVVASTHHDVKVSIRSEQMIPDIALVDPLLTMDCPPAVIASSGLDALTQCIEPYVSCKANPITDILAMEGIKRAAKSLVHAYTDRENAAWRTDMSLSSLLGGMALANSKLGAVHALAGVLGGVLRNASHGALCGLLLPLVFDANAAALTKSTDPAHQESLGRHLEISRVLTGASDGTIRQGVLRLQDIVRQLEIPGLRSYGLSEEMMDGIVEGARRSSSMKGNPIVLENSALKEVLKAAM